MCSTIDMIKTVYTYYAISLLRGPYRYGKRNSLCGEAAQDRMREHKSEEP